MDVGVVRSKTDIFGEVSDLVFTEWIVGGVVDVDVVVVSVFLALSLVVVITVLQDKVLDFLDDLGVEEVVGEDFVHWWQDDSVQVEALEYSVGESCDELVLVDVDAGPGSSLQERFVVLGTQEYLSEESDLLAKLAHRVGVWSSFGLYMASLDETNVVLDYRWVLVVLEVRLKLVIVSKFTVWLVW